MVIFDTSAGLMGGGVGFGHVAGANSKVIFSALFYVFIVKFIAEGHFEIV